MNRQYLACAFTEGGRTYTYHYDGEDQIEVGDHAIVDSRDGGEAKVVVVEIVSEAPPFPTKPIKGKAPAEPEGEVVG